jgi:hypothetical protein
MKKSNSLVMWFFVIVVLLIVIRITPLQRFNPLATPADCMPKISHDSTKQQSIRTILFGARCVVY